MRLKCSEDEYFEPGGPPGLVTARRLKPDHATTEHGTTPIDIYARVKYLDLLNANEFDIRD